MKIAIIGTGAVGRTLASKLAELNHEIMMGTRNVSDKLAVTTSDDRGNPPSKNSLIKWAGKMKILLISAILQEQGQPNPCFQYGYV